MEAERNWEAKFLVQGRRKLESQADKQKERLLGAVFLPYLKDSQLPLQLLLIVSKPSHIAHLLTSFLSNHKGGMPFGSGDGKAKYKAKPCATESLLSLSSFCQSTVPSLRLPSNEEEETQ